jgi:hypothetical protein
MCYTREYAQWTHHCYPLFPGLVLPSDQKPALGRRAINTLKEVEVVPFYSQRFCRFLIASWKLCSVRVFHQSIQNKEREKKAFGTTSHMYE